MPTAANTFSLVTIWMKNKSRNILLQKEGIKNQVWGKKKNLA